MRISIFEGKKAYYNRAILKLLVEKEPLKAWDIAKYIAKGSMDKTQDVYATLVRRNGRLNELLEKEYISKLPNKRFAPTFKGVIAYLLTEKNPKISNSYQKIISNLSLKLPENMKIPILDIYINKNIFQTYFTTDKLMELKSFLQHSLKWVDLDNIHEEEIFMLILTRLNREKIEELAEVFKKFGKF